MVNVSRREQRSEQHSAAERQTDKSVLKMLRGALSSALYHAPSWWHVLFPKTEGEDEPRSDAADANDKDPNADSRKALLESLRRADLRRRSHSFSRQRYAKRPLSERTFNFERSSFSEATPAKLQKTINNDGQVRVHCNIDINKSKSRANRTLPSNYQFKSQTAKRIFESSVAAAADDAPEQSKRRKEEGVDRYTFRKPPSLFDPIESTTTCSEVDHSSEASSNNRSRSDMGILAALASLPSRTDGGKYGFVESGVDAEVLRSIVREEIERLHGKIMAPMGPRWTCVGCFSLNDASLSKCPNCQCIRNPDITVRRPVSAFSSSQPSTVTQSMMPPSGFETTVASTATISTPMASTTNAVLLTQSVPTFSFSTPSSEPAKTTSTTESSTGFSFGQTVTSVPKFSFSTPSSESSSVVATTTTGPASTTMESSGLFKFGSTTTSASPIPSRFSFGANKDSPVTTSSISGQPPFGTNLFSGAVSSTASSVGSAPINFGASTSSGGSMQFGATTSSSLQFGTAPSSSTSAQFGSASTGGPPQFGATTTTTSSGGATFGATTTPISAIKFGSTATSSSSPITFGAATTTSSGPITFGAAITTSSGPIQFGAATTTSSGPIQFGAATTTSSGPIKFGAATTSSGPIKFGAAITSSGPITFGASTTNSSPITFGAATTTSSGPITFGAATSSGPIKFGAPPATTSSSGPVQFGAGRPFGSTPTTSSGTQFGQLFGSATASTAESAPSSTPTFTFTKPATGFLFKFTGTSQSSSTPPAAAFGSGSSLFSTPPVTSTSSAGKFSMFGTSNATVVSSSSQPSTLFGASAATTSQQPPTASNLFTFKASVAGATPVFQFGSTNSDASGAAKPGPLFSFGAGGSNSGPTFGSGQEQQPKPFSFGQPATEQPGTADKPSIFVFSGGRPSGVAASEDPSKTASTPGSLGTLQEDDANPFSVLNSEIASRKTKHPRKSLHRR